jgi:aryl-alcohol dehydrogenase-like predicted oxidoreductase
MRYNEAGDTGVELSAIALGGHEYLPEGPMRGFNEDFEAAVEPGVAFEGYGGERRRELVRTALEAGLTLFDATIDAEKEALGRNLDDLDADDALVQTRPAGMCYGYDECNRSMTDYDALRGEVERILDLLRRDRIDFLNLGFEAESLDHDPGFLDALGGNVARLKEEGLIGYADADCLSNPIEDREETYLRAIQSGAFDVVNTNFNFADDWPAERVFSAAADAGMGVVTREAFLKGSLFEMAAEAGVDADRAARAAIRWVLDHDAVTTVIVGADTAAQFESNLRALDREFDARDGDVLDDLRATAAYEEYVD